MIREIDEETEVSGAINNIYIYIYIHSHTHTHTHTHMYFDLKAQGV